MLFLGNILAVVLIGALKRFEMVYFFSCAVLGVGRKFKWMGAICKERLQNRK